MADNIEQQLLDMIKYQEERQKYVDKLNRERLQKEDEDMEKAGNERYKEMAEKAEKTAGGTDVDGKLSILARCKNMVIGAYKRWSDKHEKVSPTPKVSPAPQANIEYFHTR